MCFLKKFERIPAVPVSKTQIFEDTDAYSSEQSSFVTKKDDIILDIEQIQSSEKKQNGNGMLMNLFSLLNYNSVLMGSLEMVIVYVIQKINKNNETLDDLNSEMV